MSVPAASGATVPAAFGTDHAEVYELTYRHRGKSWEDEARDVTAIVRAQHPDAASLLDVACGTGAHLAEFARHFDHTEGVEIAPAMRQRALDRLPPGTAVHAGDMRTIRLGRHFDAVTCLFTSAAFLPTPADLTAAIRRMAEHLVPGGVLVVEPWYFPENFLDGYLGGDLVRMPDRVVSRVSHSVRRADATHLHVEWTVADAAGIRRFTEFEVMSLFTREQYLAAFDAAGCDAHYRPGWLTGRGLFVAVRRPGRLTTRRPGLERT
ncbi:class I SAM-dependent methyltransferase [Amycolatopsis rhizosphaerae]|uniref:Class I SAM-dependent methyltransferase n=1 Tax=Amycolatopsis rhizosphaerae TaxID=2053003 RepID=A0A558DHN2_9PSEU|nr:class I SAM-dependent methyltransferase [Amycolatopsis rhizosphaerae]TVT60496.1 class I SAM-dependent methyltransferase [Amycolatopsis rhizosphaerae]